MRGDNPEAAAGSAFTEAANQAASIPAVVVSLAAAGAAYLVARQWWAGVGDAFRVVPIFYLLVVLGAALCVVLLALRARLVDDQRAAWVATGIAIAGVAALGQATAIMRLSNAPLAVDPDGLAALYLLWHAALVVFAVGAIFTPDAVRVRWLLAGVFAVSIVAAVGGALSGVLPDLVDTKDHFTALYDGLRTGLTIATILTLGAWLLASGRRPTRPQIWIAVGLGLAAADLVVAAGAEQLFASMWWSSAALRAAQFAVPAIGLLADALRLIGRLHLHEQGLTQRLEHERELAARLLDAQAPSDTDEQRIRTMLEQRAFRPVFQPIYSLHTGQMTAVEALTRFDTDPPRPPAQWFDEAWRSGLGVELELATLAAALAAADPLPTGVALSVNLSPATLTDPRLRQQLTAAGMAGLIVEITEHAAVADYHRLVDALAGLRRDGLLIAIDDAGAGFSSLQHIVHLRPDIIKLDMSLTRDIDRDPVRRALAASMIDFARQIGVELIAEGVETSDELDTLRTLGAHAAQGYLLARPGDLPAPRGAVVPAAGNIPARS